MNDPNQPSFQDRSTVVCFLRWLTRWRTLRRGLIVLAWAATIIALLYAQANWRGRRAWTRYRGGLEARGEQLDYAVFIPKPVPDDQNFAATPFIKSWFDKETLGQLDKVWNDKYPEAAKSISSPKSTTATRQFLDLVAWGMAFDAIQSGQTNANHDFKSDTLDLASRAKSAPAIVAGLETSEPRLAELRAASSRPHSRFGVTYDLDNPWGILLPHLASVKSACLRLQLKGCAELAAGRSEAALEDVKLTLALADSLKEDPFLISYLVRLACVQIAIQPVWEGLAERRWSDAQLQELQKRLQPCDFVSDMKHPFDAERAAGILTVELIRKKGLGMLVELSGSESPVPQGQGLAKVISPFIPSGWYYLEELNYCRLYEMQLAGAFDIASHRVSPSQIAANGRQLEEAFSAKGIGALMHHHVVAATLLPALGKVPLKAATAQTASDQALLACALERFRLAKGQFPDRLEELVPQFAAKLPHDVLTGYSYNYQRADDGQFVLYSVGWDDKDDGGSPGKSLFDEKQGDWIWQYPKP